MSLLLPAAGGADLLVGRLLADAAQDEVRHARALAYEVGMDAVPVTPELSEVAVYAACEPEQSAEVAGLLVGLVRRMRDEGPEAGALELEQHRSRSVWTSTPDHLEVAAETAVQLLTGQAPLSLADRLAQVDGLRRRAGARRARARRGRACRSCCPSRRTPGIDGVHECRHDADAGRRPGPPRQPARRAAARGAGPAVARRVRSTRGEEGLTLRLAGETSTVRWDQVAAVVRQPHALTVLAHDGTAILLPDGTFLGGGRSGARSSAGSTRRCSSTRSAEPPVRRPRPSSAASPRAAVGAPSPTP